MSRVVRVGFAAATAAALACGSSERAFDATPAPAPVPKDAGSPSSPLAPPPEPPADAASTDAGLDGWPTCDAMPASAAARTIPEIRQADPATESETWISGAYVVAISGGACAAGKACQIFVQSDTSYASLSAAAKHAIKIFVSSSAALHFTSVRVGDRVDVLGWAWRYDVGGQNELLVQVNDKLAGCAKTTSSGNALTPITEVTLADLTVAAYETTHGPLFVRLAHVSGRPDPTPTTTFGLWPTTDGGSFDGGAADAGASIVSLSPYFLASSAFSGLTVGVNARFATLTGVFGLFVPSAGAKYLELYPRAMADIVLE